MILTWAQSGGMNAPTSFQLPLGDAGSGAVSLVAQGGGSTTPTFTRATTAWTKLSTGLWASVASGTARSLYLGADTTVGAYGGYLPEGARTNLALQSRDLSNASWTKLNATGAKDQVGIDGAANSASSLTATAINGSALQTITEAATASAFSLYIKRITGTGTVTIQQGATTSEISGSLNSSTYTRVELDATVLNPAIGIVLGTSGDKIAVDMVQFENGGFASSPIPTTTVAVTRNADVLTYPSAGNINNTAGTAYVEAVIPTTGRQSTLLTNMVPGYPMLITSANKLAIYDGSFRNLGSFTASKSVQKIVTSWSGSVTNGAIGGVLGDSSPSTFSGTLNGGANIYVGYDTTGDNAPYGTIRNVRIFGTALSAAQLQAMTT